MITEYPTGYELDVPYTLRSTPAPIREYGIATFAVTVTVRFASRERTGDFRRGVQCQALVIHQARRKASALTHGRTSNCENGRIAMA